MSDDQDNLILCDDAAKLEWPVCWPTDAKVAEGMIAAKRRFSLRRPIKLRRPLRSRG